MNISKTINNLLNLIEKEMRVTLATKAIFGILFIAPLMQLLLFSQAATLTIKNVAIAIENQDTGGEGLILSKKVASSDIFTKVYMIHGEDKGFSMIASSKVLIHLIIPVNFTKNIVRGDTAQIFLYTDGRRSAAAAISASYINSILQSFLADKGISGGISVNNIYEYNDNLTYMWYVVPCLIGILTFMISLSTSVMSFPIERDEGTIEMIFVSPTSDLMLLISKTIPFMIYAMIEATLIFLASVTFFKLHFHGNLISFAFVLLLFSLAMVSMGLTMSIIVKSKLQASLMMMLITNPMMTTSGYATPVANMPKWIQIADWANPVYHLMELLKAIYMKGASIFELPAHLIGLMVISAVSFSISLRMLKKVRRV